MQLVVLLFVTLSLTVVNASFFPLAGGSQTILGEDLKVPGENPFYHCSTPKDEILDLSYVNLDPNPPEAGTTLNVTAKGTLSEEVKEGAKIHLEVKYDLIRLLNQDADLCETIANVDLECPLKKGETEVTKSVELPKRIPPGKYTILANVVTKDDDKITCLTATVHFGR